MNDLVMPGLVGFKKANAKIDEEFFAAAPEERGRQLPEPTGYRLLCVVPEVEKVTEGGIHKSDATLHTEHLLATVLFVVKLGPDCYKDKKKFPTGPWCKEGDFVVVRPHAGTRIKVQSQEMRLLTDDSIEAVVDDPRGFRRA